MVSVGIQPDIISLDAVTAVGARTFAEKAERSVGILINAASILMLASHRLDIIRAFCTSAIWLARGPLMASELVHDICQRYSTSLRPRTGAWQLAAE